MRITIKKASEFMSAKQRHMLTVNAVRYLEMADGDFDLAEQISDYYLDGGEKNYTIGQVIRDYWLREGRKDGAG